MQESIDAKNGAAPEPDGMRSEGTQQPAQGTPPAEGTHAKQEGVQQAEVKLDGMPSSDAVTAPRTAPSTAPGTAPADAKGEAKGEAKGDAPRTDAPNAPRAEDSPPTSVETDASFEL